MAKAEIQQLRLADNPDRPAVGAALPMLRVQRWQAIAAALGSYLLTCGIFIAFFYTPPYHAEVGAPASQTVTAPVALSLPDREATAQQRDRFHREQPQIWVRNGQVVSSVLQRLRGFFGIYGEHEPANAAELRAAMARARESLNVQLDEDNAGAFLKTQLATLSPPLSRDELQRNLEFIVDEMLIDHKIVENKPRFQVHSTPSTPGGAPVLHLVDERHNQIVERIDAQQTFWWPAEVRSYITAVALQRYFPGASRTNEQLREACANLLMQVLGPNLIHDVTGSLLLDNELEKALLAGGIVKNYEAGELIAKQGEPLTSLQADALIELNRQRAASLAYKFAGIFLFVATIFFAVGIYLRRFRRDVTLDAPTILLHASLPLIAVIIGCIIVKISGDKDVIAIWFPSILVGSLSTLLIAPQVAFILVLVSTLTFGIIMGQDVSFIVMALFQGFAAVLATRQMRERLEILRVGLKVGLVNLFTLTLVSLLKQQLFTNPSFPLISFLTAILYSGSLYYLIKMFEYTFHLVTDLALLELTGLQHQLLLNLEERAPGSFQHVLNVTKLAETAANAIGANYLLVRAGAYFHDIGKMLSPKYFSENQTSIEDKKSHSKISPYMSVLIIKNHVKEGVKLAKEFRPPLPQRVIDFIPEHHGTSLIRYFYAEALKRYEESEAVDPVREEDFRYPGPKPRSIETAIVMIADTVEAVTTAKFTSGQVQENELRNVVQAAITEKFNDGQFDECSLTLRHLHMIRESLVHALMARFHFRVQYPTLPGRMAGVQSIPVRDNIPISISGPAA